jgi:hypothetical protein
MLKAFLANLCALPGEVVSGFVDKLAPHAKTPAAQDTVSAAQADPTVEKIEAAAEAVLDPMVETFVAGLAQEVPILGPVFAGDVEVEAVSLEHAALEYAIGKLSGFLPKPPAA